MKLVIVTGMSGAGKTIALKMLEDLGFYCVDNLPISLADKFVQLVSDGGTVQKAALGIDIRSGDELSALNRIFDEWSRSRVPYEILFLDAGSETLIKRYKESRRIHPLAGEGRIDSGIEKERLKLAFLKEEADYISCSQWVYGVIEALETLVIPQLYSEHPAQRQTNRKR